MAFCLYGQYTHVPVQLTDSTPTRSSKRVKVGERGTTVNWRSTGNENSSREWQRPRNGEEKSNDCRQKYEEITALETKYGGNKK